MKTINKTSNFLFAASVVIAAALASPAYAGFYFDAGTGLGVGMATEIYRDNSYYSNYNWNDEENREGIGMDYSLRIGGGPSKIGSGLFFVGELSMELSTYTPLSCMIGPGIIFYPTQNLQLGASAGLSPIVGYYENTYEGTAFNFSIAYDFGNRNHGLLIGMKFYIAYGESNDLFYYENNTIETSTISIFVKYAYRKKRALEPQKSLAE